VQHADFDPGRREACTGGQGESPNEQKTQQSPGLGCSIALQAAHS
jgi:hypothetical protein